MEKKVVISVCVSQTGREGSKRDFDWAREVDAFVRVPFENVILGDPDTPDTLYWST